MSDSLIQDIRAVNYWEYIEPPWDGVTIPRPEKQLVVTNYQLQIRKIVVDAQGQPTLSDWTPIQVLDHYPSTIKVTP